jgi:peptide/nickel transport system substrate-binding protein
MITRRSLLASTAGATALGARLASVRAAPDPASGPLNIAVIFDPPGLDPTVNAVDLVSTITENVFDTLYAYDANWQPAPLLAAGPAAIADGGRTVTIPLRQGVPFSDGTMMSSADVVASLRRWLKLSSRGQLVAPILDAIEAPAADKVVFRLKSPYPALMGLLAFNSGTAIVMPKAKAEAAMDGPIARIEDIVGTGPYRIAERRPAQFILLDRSEHFVPSPMPPSGYAGARTPASSQLSFIPVPNVNTRLQGLISGQYDAGMGLSTDNYGQIEHTPSLVPVITKPGGWLFLVMNTKQGLTANPLIRQAVQAALDNEAIMLAAMGSPQFYELGASLYPGWSPYHSDAGAALFNRKDPAEAKKLLAQANYKGEPFRILTSQQYDYIYKAALVAMQNLQAAGFKVDLVLMDWASVMSRRFDPAIWEGFVTFHAFVPEPMLITILSPAYPGWWDTPDKRQALQVFSTATSQEVRSQAWSKLQNLLMEEAPTIQLGEYFELLAHQKTVSGVPAVPLTPFWAAHKG